MDALVGIIFFVAIVGGAIWLVYRETKKQNERWFKDMREEEERLMKRLQPRPLPRFEPVIVVRPQSQKAKTPVRVEARSRAYASPSYTPPPDIDTVSTYDVLSSPSYESDSSCHSSHSHHSSHDHSSSYGHHDSGHCHDTSSSFVDTGGGGDFGGGGSSGDW